MAMTTNNHFLEKDEVTQKVCPCDTTQRLSQFKLERRAGVQKFSGRQCHDALTFGGVNTPTNIATVRANNGKEGEDCQQANTDVKNVRLKPPDDKAKKGIFNLK